MRLLATFLIDVWATSQLSIFSTAFLIPAVLYRMFLSPPGAGTIWVIVPLFGYGLTLLLRCLVPKPVQPPALRVKLSAHPKLRDVLALVAKDFGMRLHRSIPAAESTSGTHSKILLPLAWLPSISVTTLKCHAAHTAIRHRLPIRFFAIVLSSIAGREPQIER